MILQHLSHVRLHKGEVQVLWRVDLIVFLIDQMVLPGKGILYIGNLLIYLFNFSIREMLSESLLQHLILAIIERLHYFQVKGVTC